MAENRSSYVPDSINLFCIFNFFSFFLVEVKPKHDANNIFSVAVLFTALCCIDKHALQLCAEK